MSIFEPKRRGPQFSLIEFRHVLNCWAQRITSVRHPGKVGDVYMLSMGLMTYCDRFVNAYSRNPCMKAAVETDI